MNVTPETNSFFVDYVLCGLSREQKSCRSCASWNLIKEATDVYQRHNDASADRNVVSFDDLPTPTDDSAWPFDLRCRR